MKLRSPRFSLFALSASAALVLSACGGGGSDSSAVLGWHVAKDEPVKIQFAAYNGNTPIDCSSSFKLGTTGKAVKVQDLRFFVSQVQLLKADGSKVRLELSSKDDTYNYDDGTHAVTLIDLEDGTGLCSKGTADINAVVEGTVPAGNYTGVELEIGVPQPINHTNSTAATTPAALRTDVHPGMSWNWRGGRKFTKLEFRQDTDADKVQWESAKAGNSGIVLLHLGSTGCVAQNDVPGAAKPSTVDENNPVRSCKAPNRLPLQFTAFNPGTQQIALDVGALFHYDIAGLAEGFSGCMSAPTDRACVKQFEALALDFGRYKVDANGEFELDTKGYKQVDGTGTGLPVTGKTQTVFKVMGKKQEK